MKNWLFRLILLTTTFFLLLIAFQDIEDYSRIREIYGTRRSSSAEQVLRVIPPNASVAAPARLLTQLSQRRPLYAVNWVADYPVTTLDYVILDTNAQTYETSTVAYQQFVMQIRGGGRCYPLLSADGIEVYECLPRNKDPRELLSQSFGP